MLARINLKLNGNVHNTLLKRGGHILRGKLPGVARTLEQRLLGEKIKDAETTEKVNIGFPKLRGSRWDELKQRLLYIRSLRKNSDLEKQARANKLVIDLNKVRDEYQKTSGQYHLKTIAEHYGIFNDLFGDAYFIPRIPLKITYESDPEYLSPVFNGNVIKPNEAKTEPNVSYDASTDIITRKKCTEDTYWSLLLTNPDGHFSGEKLEYVHWFKGNIVNDQVKKGELIVPYLQPFPPRGIGYQRLIFILYKQNKEIDFSQYKINKLNDLNGRTFSSLEFYKKFQDDITPAGLAFFQSDWESSITDFYHTVLDMEEPIYKYEFPRTYINDQKWFPLRQPFNMYMDKYRDPKKIHQEYLERKLAKVHPFEGPPVPLRFPNAHPLKNIPSWLKTEIRKDRLKIGRINDV